jgi:hypothetical protein
MKEREFVVRIVRASEKPRPPKRPKPVEIKPEKNMFQLCLGAAALAIIAAIACQLGISFREIMVLVGLPLAVGLVTSYALL